MPYCKQIGKDKIIFATKGDHAIPSKVQLPKAEPSPGLLLANGEINWDCPCLGGMATGPCGVPFQEAFSCFHYSEAEPKGSDCYESFKAMQECMSKYPSLYNNKEDDGTDDKAPLEVIVNASEESSREKEETRRVEPKETIDSEGS